jgi:23S rRNA (cytosine1962-C5)-methyltransferase
MTQDLPRIATLCPRNWDDYELLDSGDGAKLERFGKYVLARPEKRALWKRFLPDTRWQDADAVFRHSGEKGEWVRNRAVPDKWQVRYGNVASWVKLTRFRHTGIFPEQAPLWDWIDERIRSARAPVKMLNLFAYTGMASLVAAAAGASVTHLDASKPSLDWARENAAAAQLADRPIRWILDDALKFLKREHTRGVRYEGIVLNPPAFGRGPKGEVWRLEDALPKLLEACDAVLAERPVSIAISINGAADSSLALYNLLTDWLGSRGGTVSSGELVLQDRANRPLSMGVYGTWSADDAK